VKKAKENMNEVKKENEKKKVNSKVSIVKNNKTKKKNIKKNESIPMNKLSKTVGIVSGIGIFCLLLIAILSNLSIDIGNFVWLNIRNPIFGFLFKIFSVVPTIGMMFPIIIFLLTFIYLGFILFFELRKKIKFKKRVIYSNICLALMFVNLFMILMPTIFTMLEYGYGKLNYEYFNSNVDTKYTKEDLIELNKYYQEKILALADSFERDNGSIIYEQDILDTSVNNLLNISNEYKFLKGWYPKKVAAFTKRDYTTNVDQTIGYTMGYGIKVDTEGDKVMLMHVLTHELCHTKGLIRESETEFCAYVASINGDNLSQYAAYIDALGRVNYALYMIDREVSFDLEEPVLNLCLEKEYEEICGYYIKEIKHYVNDSYLMEISSYRLRNYQEYFDEISSILMVLENDYKARFSIGDRENVSLGAIQAEIINGSKESLLIEIDINKDKFDKLSNYLIDCDKYFVSIYQINDDTEEPDDRTSEDAFDYYLKPFNKKSDIISSFGNKFIEEYDYERVTRLLLEYHHDELKERLLSE